MDNFHIPVLLEEVIQGLRVKGKGLYVDVTIGGGGHTRKILELGGVVLGIDKDEDSILHLKKKFESEIKENRLVLERENYANLEKITKQHEITRVDGILFDLGVSSNQIDRSGRGFSFQRDEPLDMRMDAKSKLTAEEIVNNWPEEELYEIFAKYGEDREARNIAKKIIAVRKITKITTTLQLSNLILGIVRKSGKLHPATRIFQALRIVVNDEINNLKIGLKDGFKLLKCGGRLAVISFHSLEDRVVKLAFQEFEMRGEGRMLFKKPIIASFGEVKQNRRARSAKLRVIERV